LVDVKASLVHQQVEGGKIFVFEVDVWLRQVFVDYMGEDVYVSSCVALDSLQELNVSLGSIIV
jgi:hypothetical protein